MAEISAINNFKKYNSGSGRSSINNVVKEAFRELEKFKNNVNQELTQFNKILVKDLSVLERQYYDTEVDSRRFWTGFGLDLAGRRIDNDGGSVLALKPTKKPLLLCGTR